MLGRHCLWASYMLTQMVIKKTSVEIVFTSFYKDGSWDLEKMLQFTPSHEAGRFAHCNMTVWIISVDDRWLSKFQPYRKHRICLNLKEHHGAHCIRVGAGVASIFSFMINKEYWTNPLTSVGLSSPKYKICSCFKILLIQ